MENRREFLLKTIKTGAALSLFPFVNACTKGGISPFEKYKILDEFCTGCGDCVPACPTTAILLPQKSMYLINEEKCTDCGDCFVKCPESAIILGVRKYQIDKSNCTECGKCEPVCPQNAVFISLSDYVVEEEQCVGCGDCIDVCVNEGNCIIYEKEEYTVRNKCANRSCHLECIAVCPEGAITKTGDLAEIDMSKCTKCGKCVSSCPHDAINPAKVEIKQDDCTHCGKCYSACTFNAINKETSEEYAGPYIDTELCGGCGECIKVCEDDAISYEQAGQRTTITQGLCTQCGDCYDVCIEEHAIDRDLKTAAIVEDDCTNCGECVLVCSYDAISR